VTPPEAEEDGKVDLYIPLSHDLNFPELKASRANHTFGVLADLIAKPFAARRLAMLIVTVFSLAALLLAAIGLYGVLAYSVSLRKRELGIRMALGAPRSNVVRLVTQQGLGIVGVGLTAGIGTALILSHLVTVFIRNFSRRSGCVGDQRSRAKSGCDPRLLVAGVTRNPN
jgi:hypothetical protein